MTSEATARFEYVYPHRVRYRECDPMSVVYHTHYLDYFEAARTEALRSLGLAYKSLEDAGIIMPVVDVSIRFRAPARYDDQLEIKAIFVGVPSTRVSIDYEVRRQGEDNVLVLGTVVLCFVDAASGRPIPAPDHVQKLFS